MGKKKTFEQLQKEWSEKLAAKGFVDIEDSKGRLKEFHSYRFQKEASLPPEQLELTRDYYSLAGELLDTFPFPKKVHRRIWELHCAGWSAYDISDQLKKEVHEQEGTREVTSRRAVSRIITEYQQYIK